MQLTKTLRLLLILSGLVAIGIGSSILLAPAQFHASYGIELGTDPNLLSEVRAPGGTLAVLGLLMLVGAFARAFTPASIAVATAVYLGYGVSRILSIGFDGWPHQGLIGAALFELALGAANAVVWTRAVPNRASAIPRGTGVASGVIGEELA